MFAVGRRHPLRGRFGRLKLFAQARLRRAPFGGLPLRLGFDALELDRALRQSALEFFPALPGPGRRLFRFHQLGVRFHAGLFEAPQFGFDLPASFGFFAAGRLRLFGRRLGRCQLFAQFGLGGPVFGHAALQLHF